jgi:hypothetical protein
MNGNAELLNFIYQNSQMGVQTISQLLDIADDQDFKKYLNAQLNGYDEIHTQARELLNQNGYDEKGLSAFEKVRTYLMINMETLINKTTSHIAEMLLLGSNMGVIDAIKNLKKYKGEAEADIIQLMEQLLAFEENNAKELKLFL